MCCVVAKLRKRERDWRSDFFVWNFEEWMKNLNPMDEQLNLSWIGVVSISLSHTLLTRPDSSKRFFSANPRFVNFSLSLSLSLSLPLILNFSVLNLSFLCSVFRFPIVDETENLFFFSSFPPFVMAMWVLFVLLL